MSTRNTKIAHAAAATAALLGATLFSSGEAHAQATREGFTTNRFEPSERGSYWFANESLDLRGKVRPAIGLVADYSYRSLLIFAPDGDVRASVVRNAFYLHPGASLVLFDRLRLATSLPIQAGVDGHFGTVTRNGVTTGFLPPPDNGGLGDLRVGADVRLYGVHGDAITIAGGLQAWFPTGSTAQYAGDGAFRLRPRVMVSGDVDIFTYAGQVGVLWRERNETVGAGSIGSEINLSAAAGVKILDKNLVVGPEAWAGTVFDDAFKKKTTPVEVGIGAHYLIANQFRVGAGGALGMTRAFGAPVGRYMVSLEWVPGVDEDKDGDGIKDSEDACPDVKGVRSAEPSKNGCPPDKVAAPPPSDRDNDGILDPNDACPDVPGIKTNDPATNGCRDTDGDGIFDPKDACPNERGAPNADPTLAGCPDTDGDGILDKQDACPQEAGPKSEDPKKNGCPVRDRDKDGITDDVDACPDEPGPTNTDPKKNGCPMAFIQDGQIRILQQVKFKTGSAAIEQGKDSVEVLEAVQKVLAAHPEIKKIRVEGHTDNKGAKAMNQKLSADRAASVVKWLTAHGIDKSRLASKGFGPDKPIDTNDTDNGRTNNRRVEFHIE